MFDAKEWKIMNTNAMCISCMLSKQEKQIRRFEDEERKSEYIHQVLEILHQYGRSESSPQIAERIDALYKEYWEDDMDYTLQRKKYNQLMLRIENNIEQKIQESDDPLKACIKYVCTGNYIDFSAVECVNETTLKQLLEKAAQETVREEEYLHFRDDLEKAGRLVYLTDNCGEVVLDKIFIKQIKKEFPDLQITVIVRGEDVINDATLDDAKEVGLTDIVTCIGNGNAAPGTVLSRLSEEAKAALMDADVVISKGQGNFESLYGEGFNPYYLFLCKCELFVHRFGLKQYESVFVKEERCRSVR